MSERPVSGAWPDLSLFGVAMIWGINIPIMKIGLGQMDALVFNAIRLIISAITLVLLAARERKKTNSRGNGSQVEQRISYRHWMIYSLLSYAAYQIMFLFGIDGTTSGNTALIIATVPLWTAFLAWAFLGESLHRFAWGGLALALVGTCVVAWEKGDVSAGSQHLFGNLMILSAALTWSIGTVYSRPLLKKISPTQLAARAAVLALPIHLVIAWGRYDQGMQQLQSTSVILIVVYAGVLSSGLALPMWNFGVRHAGAAHAAIIQNVIPLIAIAGAWLWLGDIPTQRQILGGTLILGGLIIMRMTRRWG